MAEEVYISSIKTFHRSNRRTVFGFWIAELLFNSNEFNQTRKNGVKATFCCCHLLSNYSFPPLKYSDKPRLLLQTHVCHESMRRRRCRSTALIHWLLNEAGGACHGGLADGVAVTASSLMAPGVPAALNTACAAPSALVGVHVCAAAFAPPNFIHLPLLAYVCSPTLEFFGCILSWVCGTARVRSEAESQASPFFCRSGFLMVLCVL